MNNICKFISPIFLIIFNGGCERSDELARQDSDNESYVGLKVKKIPVSSECEDISGFLSDRTRGGRRVYQEPDEGSKPLGVVREPVEQTIDGSLEIVEVGFAIRAASDGWLQISGAHDDPQLTGKPARKMFSGEGWIRGNGVVLGVQATQGFAAPDFGSPIVVRRSGGWLDTDIAGMQACNGRWVKLDWNLSKTTSIHAEPSALAPDDPKIATAWVTGICNIPETTCDGLSGDRADQTSASH